MSVILIAGATSMIGRACIKALDSDQHTLILMGRDSDALALLSKTIQTKHHVHTQDFTSLEKVSQSLKAIEAECGPVNAFVYNISMYPWKTIENLSVEEWEQALRVNMGGAFALTQALVPSFKKMKQGQIVYISSIAGEINGLPNMSAYAASKAGLNGFMRTCALELAPYNVTVNSISPGKVYDPKTLSPDEVTEKLGNVPLKRFVDPSDIAHMVDFLISDKAQNITGQNIIIDGGQSIV